MNKKAWTALERAASLLRPEMNQQVKIFTLINLASCLARMKSFMKAAECLADALNGLEDVWLKSCVLVNLAAVKCELGFFQQALEIDLSVLKDLNDMKSGINKDTVEVVVCRNVAVVCAVLKQAGRVKVFEGRAKEVAMKKLGPSNLLTMVLQRFRVFEISPVQFQIKKEKKNERFLKKIRFITGERLQPMHNNRNAWTKRLKSLHLNPIISANQSNDEKRESSRSLINEKFSNISELVENIRKCSNKYRNKTQENQNLPKFEEKEVESMKNIKHKSIKIVNFKDLRRNKEKNRAAVIIQKNFRMFSQRQKYLLFKKIGKKIEYRMETLDMFNSKKLGNLTVKESEEYEENDSEENESKLNKIKDSEVLKKTLKKQDSNKSSSLTEKEPFFDEKEKEFLEDQEKKSEKNDTEVQNDEEKKSTSEMCYSDDFKSSISEPNLQTIEEKSALTIQKHYRNHLSLKYHGFPITSSTLAALKIQKAFRSRRPY